MDLKTLLPTCELNKHLMMLGTFKFQVFKTCYDQMVRSASFRWSEQKRLYGVSKQKFGGIDAEDIELSGMVHFKLSEKLMLSMYDNVVSMAKSGSPQSLVTGDGKNLGQWVITNFRVIETNYNPSGVPNRMTFTLNLRSYDK